MHRVYEIFEILPDGSRGNIKVVSGLEIAKAAVEELSKRTANECIAADRRTRQVVVQRNIPEAKWRTIRRIFQIAYDEQTGLQRAELLRSLGYGVISVVGNEAAKFLLASIQDYDIFIVGPAAPEQDRKEIIAWLRANYPNVPILALNPPHQKMNEADSNAVFNGDPETWLPFVTARLTPKNCEISQVLHPIFGSYTQVYR